VRQIFRLSQENVFGAKNQFYRLKVFKIHFVFQFEIDVFAFKISSANDSEQKICRAQKCGDVFGRGFVVNVIRRSDLFQSARVYCPACFINKPSSANTELLTIKIFVSSFYLLFTA